MATMQTQFKFIANDGTSFDVDQDVAFKSQMIKDIIIYLGATEEVEVPVAEADGKTLKKIIDYCIEHRTENYKKKSEKEDQRIVFTEKHIKYFKDVSDDFLMKLLMGAYYLDIHGLLDIITQKIADMIKGMNVAQIREQYRLKDDLPKEEQEKIRRKYDLYGF